MTSKRQLILKTAFELFVEKGFKATTTKEIAHKCGIAEGLIFYYFKDKNDLLKNLTREFSFIESVQNEMKELSGIEPVDALVKFAHLYTNFVSSHKNFLTFIWSPEMVQNRDVSDEVIQLIQSMTHFVEINLEKAVSDSVNTVKIKTAASMFLSTLLAKVLIGERISEQNEPENETFILTVVELTLNGLKAST